MKRNHLVQYAIVADIGGTFARFGRVDLDHLQVDYIEIYPCSAFTSLEAALVAYQAQHALQNIKHVAIAIASPVIDDLICMTNCQWRVSIDELKHKLDLTVLKVMNDYTAVAMSLPQLAHDEIVQIGNGYLNVSKTKVVLGPGTGLGVAFLVPGERGFMAYAGEGGHSDWGAKTEQEWFIYSYLKEIYPHVSQERLLSGQGLEDLYKAIAAFKNKTIAPLEAAQIITLALARQCTIAQAAVAQFFASLGAYAGDLALTFSAFGGVYIAGGIVPRLLSLIRHSDFRFCFEDKGRFNHFNVLIPTFVVTAEQPGILGAAVSLKQSLSVMGALDVVS